VPSTPIASASRDEEEGEEGEYADEVRFKVERVVAMLIAAVMLLICSGALFLFVTGKGPSISIRWA
jgi:hypothetical protein